MNVFINFNALRLVIPNRNFLRYEPHTLCIAHSIFEVILVNFDKTAVATNLDRM